jgi:hypothetical protein
MRLCTTYKQVKCKSFLGNLKRVFNNLVEATNALEKNEKEYGVKPSLKAFTLNGWACYYHQRQQNSQALRLIDEAINLEQSGIKDSISLARSHLNKCVILSQMNQYLVNDLDMTRR